MTLMNLQLAGFSEKQIMELTGFVNMWNKQWPSIEGPGIGQNNGSSSMNGFKLDNKLIVSTILSLSRILNIIRIAIY